MNAAPPTVLARAVIRRIDEVEAHLEPWDASLEDSPDPYLCQWPGCDRPRPSKQTGRAGSPKYCGEASYEGFHPHTGAAASKAKPLGAQTGSTTPVLTATATAKDSVDKISRITQQLSDELTDVVGQMAVLSSREMYDVEAAFLQAQTEAAIAEAELRAQGHLAAAVRAEAARRKAEQDAADAAAGQRDAELARDAAQLEAKAAQDDSIRTKEETNAMVQAAASAQHRAEAHRQDMLEDRNRLQAELVDARQQAAEQMSAVERLSKAVREATAELRDAERELEAERGKTRDLDREVKHLRDALAQAVTERQTALQARASTERDLELLRHQSEAAAAEARLQLTVLRSERNRARVRVRDLKAMLALGRDPIQEKSG